jgi:glycosyltransferase involved in cell wall biosynthesis
VLPHRQALALLQSADVLFMTNADGARQQLAIPGKLYEYLATGRPVMAVTHPDGAAGRLLKRTGGGIVIPADDPGELFDAIVTLCRTRRLDAPTLNPDELASFDRVALTRRLAQLLDDAVRRHAISHTHRPNHDATAADLSMATRHPRSA